MITAFLAYAVITVFAFAFSLDLVNGNGSPGSGALTPVSTARSTTSTRAHSGRRGSSRAVAMVWLWAMWKALVQRRYTETAGALAVSLVLRPGARDRHPAQQTMAQRASSRTSSRPRCYPSPANGNVANERSRRPAAGNQLFDLLVMQPWTVLEFGGIEHCTITALGKPSRSRCDHSRATRRKSPLSTHLKTPRKSTRAGKTCVNNKDK